MDIVKQVKIFADGADMDGILALYKNPLIKGFTTNPTLMRKAGIEDYEAFARQLVKAIPDRPISFEVFADDFDEMIAQGRVIASWGSNVNVKIPVTTTKGAFTGRSCATLANAGVIVNVTAITTEQQVETRRRMSGAERAGDRFGVRRPRRRYRPRPGAGHAGLPACAGRSAESRTALGKPARAPQIFQADEIGCHIITVSHDVLAKLSLVGKDLDEYSLETVKMFHRTRRRPVSDRDAARAGRRPEPFNLRAEFQIDRRRGNAEQVFARIRDGRRRLHRLRSDPETARPRL